MMDIYLAQEALMGALGFGVMAFISWIYFRYWRLPLERNWLREHAVQHWVYFRNIEWRCLEKLPDALRDGDMLNDASRVHLQKLLHDLDAFQELTRMWERRTNGLNARNRYLNGILTMADACDELVIALRRHARPMLEIDTSGPVGKKDFQAYALYFCGSGERVYGTASRNSGAGVGSIGKLARAELERQSQATLAHRLSACEIALTHATGFVIADFIIRADAIWSPAPTTRAPSP